MKIALIDPMFKRVNSNAQMKKLLATSPYLYFYSSFWSGFSTGLLTLAALTPKDVEIRYIDDNFEEIPYEEQFDIVAITATTQQATRAYAIAEEFKKIWGKRCVLVAGGYHVSYYPEEAQKTFDVIFQGEAESSWPAFLSDFSQHNWKPMYRSEDYPPVSLHEIPIPRYDLLKSDNYKMLWMQTSRGCPRSCEFCAASEYFGRRMRLKSPEQTVEEIQYARKYLKFQPVLFADDNMFLRGGQSPEFLGELEKSKIRYVAQTDIGIATKPELLEQLRRSGCSVLFIGFESLDSRNLALMNNSQWKLQQLSEYRQHIQTILQHGIGIYGAFILGYDWDTRESFKDVGDFVIDNYMAGAQITFPTPLPGTRLRRRLLKEGRVLDTPWENYTFFDVNIIHPTLSKGEMEEELYNLYQRIYSKDYLDRKNRYYKGLFRKTLGLQITKDETK
jgi:radical SAM superfamily enzyme YgiQ (UPF0313 family)